LEDQGLNPGRRNKIVSPPKPPYSFWSPYSFLFNKNRNPFLGVRRLGNEVGPSAPLSAEDKYDLIYASSSLNAFTMWKGATLLCCILGSYPKEGPIYCSLNMWRC